MNLWGAPLTLISAIVAVLSAQTLLRQSDFLYWMVDMGLGDYTASPAVDKHFAGDFWSGHLDRHRRRHKDSSKSICDDFPQGFPPPDTNDTATICVDRRGCCNFTSVQAAVDSVSVSTEKRTIIWIDKGIYLYGISFYKYENYSRITS